MNEKEDWERDILALCDRIDVTNAEHMKEFMDLCWNQPKDADGKSAASQKAKEATNAVARRCYAEGVWKT